MRSRAFTMRSCSVHEVRIPNPNWVPGPSGEVSKRHSKDRKSRNRKLVYHEAMHHYYSTPNIKSHMEHVSNTSKNMLAHELQHNLKNGTRTSAGPRNMLSPVYPNNQNLMLGHRL